MMSSTTVEFSIKDAQIEELIDLIKFARKQAYIAYFKEEDDKKAFIEYLDQEYNEAKFINYLENKENICLVVKNKEDNIIAYCIVTKCDMDFEDVNKGNDYELKKLYVEQTYQGFGLGTKLIQHFKSAIRAKYTEDYRSGNNSSNFPKIFVNVYIENEKAQRFYEKHRFKFVKINEIPYGNGVDYDKVYVGDFTLDYRD